ncbi:MAG: AGE family epimerase/isomerase [Lachnospiraceae bacterium]|jgi:mannobiose 2-epimerase|nr:AGE family epimerase/isomerase [Lachnospiraceae bacterium]
MIKKEMLNHLTDVIIPFWKGLRDELNGGYLGYVGYDLKVDEKAGKGCILNSRILWFFANAYTLNKSLATYNNLDMEIEVDEALLEHATHAYNFMRENFLDNKYGGLFWSTLANGVPDDTTKHTYNQAFAIYALASYYEAAGDEEALQLALELFTLIETKCVDNIGYKEAFDEQFLEISNEKLSENSIIANRTMNTLLHLIEAYTELYRVATAIDARKRKEIQFKLELMLSTVAEKIYNPELRRQEVFFDNEMNSIIDLHSYGHDIEAAWLIDRAVEVMGNRSYFIRMTPITANLTDEIYKVAYNGHSLAYESERAEVNESRVWWVQAEAVTGFYHAYKREPKREEYLEAAVQIWEFIKEYMIDSRPDSEWFSEVDKDGYPDTSLPMADPWKCPYHNGRMCFEIIKMEV